MKTISKHLITYGQEPTTLRLMPDFRPVFCEHLVGAKGVYLWIEQSSTHPNRAITRKFIVARPGRCVPETYEYVDSAVDPFGSQAHHVFQLPVETHRLRVAPYTAASSIAPSPSALSTP